MKPFGKEKRPKDWLPIVNFAMVDSIPRSINLREHLFSYVGCEDDPRFIWGVYGTTSINVAIYVAADAATAKRRRSLQITSWMRVDNFQSAQANLTDAGFEAASYLHLGRASSALRETIRVKWVAWVRANHGAAYGEHLDKLSLEYLAAHFPGYVRVILDENPNLRALVHPVTPSYSEGSSDAHFWVLTARYDKSQVMASEVRFVSDVEVNLW